MTYRHKSRSYIHFDKPVSLRFAEGLVSNPERVAKHSFHPFISYSIDIKKIKREHTAEGYSQIIKETKSRPIKIASHADAAIFSYYAQLLEPHYENLLVEDGTAPCISAFRSRRGTNIDTAVEVFKFTNQPHYILSFDVTGFFDNLDHDILKSEWQKLLAVERLPADHYAVYRALTRYSEVDRATIYAELGISINNPKQKHLSLDQRRKRICTPEEFRNLRSQKDSLITKNTAGKGIPQGSPISAFLSNVYMRSFDKNVSQYIENKGGLYRRYCDDIAIVLPQSCSLQAIENHIGEKIEELNLSINTGKTKRAAFPHPGGTHLDSRIQYLGFTKDQEKILIREGSLNRYYGRMRRAVRLAKRSQEKGFRRTGQRTSLKTEKLYRKYSYLVRRRSRAKQYSQHDHIGNFITYAHKAAVKFDSPDIKQQLKRHWPKLQAEIKKNAT